MKMAWRLDVRRGFGHGRPRRAKERRPAFKVRLEDGSVVRSRRMVVAAGIGPFNRKPAVFGELPALQVSHCYEGRKISEFAGKRVAVIGAGQSALESAALLHEAGADVEPIARISALRWIGMHKWLHELGPLTSMLDLRGLAGWWHIRS
jgi:thioredoxin reductase